MNESNNYWNQLYESRNNQKPVYDLWLDKYAAILSTSDSIPIIDLGCGTGNNTLYLQERNYKVISCDFSKEALKKLDYFIDKPDTRLFDMKEGLPFEDQSAKIIIADLSLHYFRWFETVAIVAEIQRVLMKDGFLLLRVNSVKDTNYGAGQGTLVEENYYCKQSRFKRFFNKAQLDDLFQNWEFHYSSEYEMSRYENTKVLWELALKKHL